MNRYLLVLCGIPASGKTTLATYLQEAFAEEGEVLVVSTDQWRDRKYYANFSPDKEHVVREKGISETKKHLSSGISVIHDDTNYYASMRHELYVLALENEFAFGIIHVNTPLERAIEWNDARESPLPENVIRRIHERFDKPGSKYAWDRPLQSIDLSKKTPEKYVPKIVKKVKKLEPLIYRKKSIPGYSEFYDKLTRQIVNDFLLEEKGLRENPQVSIIRKEMLTTAIKENLSRDQVQERLLEKLTDLKA